MVRVVSVPGFLKYTYISANDLSGHPDGITYTAKELKLRKRYRAQNNIKRPVEEEPTVPFTLGKRIS